MPKFIFSFLVSVLFTAISAQALPLPKMKRSLVELPPTFTQDFNFEGIAALSNCSGSLIRLEGSKDTDYALILTNGHCYEGGFIDPGTAMVNVDSTRSFNLLDATANTAGRVRATKLVYATMTKTDISIYRLGMTYEQILTSYGVHALTLSSKHPDLATPIEVISGYWQRGYSCQVEAFINELDEEDWKWSDSIRYSRPGCEVIGGTSGSPVVAGGTRTVIGVNNTGNEDGQRCTRNNPCEIDKDGKVTYTQGYSYGQETYIIYSCIEADNSFNLAKAGCLLPH